MDLEDGETTRQRASRPKVDGPVHIPPSRVLVVIYTELQRGDDVRSTALAVGLIQLCLLLLRLQSLEVDYLEPRKEMYGVEGDRAMVAVCESREPAHLARRFELLVVHSVLAVVRQAHGGDETVNVGRRRTARPPVWPRRRRERQELLLHVEG